MERMKFMLLRPFRFATWLKIGFMGWLASAGTSGGFNINLPSFPGRRGGTGGASAEETVRAWMHEHMLLIVLIVTLIVALLTTLGLILLYLSCRFRFILFDSVLQTDAQIGRGWSRYRRPAGRYFGFLICLLLVSGIVIALIVALPLWRAYKRGVFRSEDPFAIFGILAPVILGVFVFAVISAIITSLANDFGVPLLALDDLTVVDAWGVLREMISAEPWAFAGYLGMKLVLSIAAGAMVAFAAIAVFLVLLIPGVILAILGVAIAKAAGAVVGIVLAGIGVVAAIAIVLILSMMATAPIAVFFTSYSFYFFGGRYPKLGALLWPQPPAPVAPPAPPPPSLRPSGAPA